MKNEFGSEIEDMEKIFMKCAIDEVKTKMNKKEVNIRAVGKLMTAFIGQEVEPKDMWKVINRLSMEGAVKTHNKDYVEILVDETEIDIKF